MSQRGTSCANLYAAAVQHDKLYNASHCKSKCAFTLAEVLITLVIIGIIAALTIPNLLQKYQEQATVKKVQKFYSNLSNAYTLATKDNGLVSDWGVTANNKESATKIYELLFKPYFKIAKNCGVYNSGKCVITDRYKDVNNEPMQGTPYGQSSAFYKLALDDGSAVIFYTFDNQFIMVYDVNGIKGPNQFGVDTFYFGHKQRHLAEKIIPFGMPDVYYSFEEFCQKGRIRADQGIGCAAWVIYKGNMDYLHCDDLSWNGKDKCK